MPSKNRMTINFASKEILKIIEVEALKNKVSKSRVVEEMLRFAYSERIKNGSYFTEEKPFSRNRNDLPTEIMKSDLRVNLLQLADSSAVYCGRPERFTVSTGFTMPNPLNHDANDFFTGKRNSSVNRAQATSNACQKIKDDSKTHIDEIIRKHYIQVSMVPDYFLIFTNSVHINYSMPALAQHVIYFQITADVYALPVYMNKINNRNLLNFDFLNIKKRKFSDIALKGWNRLKYSHLLYLNTTNEIRKPQESSGYFIGIFHTPENSISEPSNLESHRIYTGVNGISDTKIKHHFDMAKITFKMVTNGIPKPNNKMVNVDYNKYDF